MDIKKNIVSIKLPATRYLLPTDYPVFLIQTDTTVGLLSKDRKKLALIKQRDEKQPFLKSVATFCELKKETRIPKKYKKFIRRKKKATFIYPNSKAIRVVQDNPHQRFLKRFGWMYSTSANKTGCKFDFGYIKDRVDIIVFEAQNFRQNSASLLFKIGKKKIRRIR